MVGATGGGGGRGAYDLQGVGVGSTEGGVGGGRAYDLQGVGEREGII